MNILFVCENYPPHYGGAEIVFKNLAEGFAKLGHEVNLITRRLKGTKKFEVINNVKIYRIHSLNTRYLFSFTSIPKVLKLAKKADIIQTTTFNGAPPAWFAAKIRKKPIIITVHEVWVGRWDKVTDFNALNCLIHNLLERMIYKLKFNKYICVSDATKKDLLKLRIKKEKVSRIHNGFNYNEFNPKKFSTKNIREKLGLKNKFVYFSWGRPGVSKGFEYIIKAIPQIRKKIKNSTFLLMMGSTEKYGRRTKYLKGLRKKLRLTKEDIKIIPSAPYNELGNYLKTVDCIVIPSISEGFGYTTIESNAMEKPTIASNIGSIPEVISGKYLLFESKNIQQIANSVIKVSNNQFKKTKLKKFLWNKCISNYLETYKELLKRN